MEHQYPGAISGDENMLAELMLPDQVHNRKEDWTIFFLHKDLSEEEDPADGEDAEEKEETKAARENGASNHAAIPKGEVNAQGAENGEDKDEVEGGEGPPLIYVLNLVNTIHDPSLKRSVQAYVNNIGCFLTCDPDRGAMVKAMAVCTRHPFLHIYKVLTPLYRPSCVFADYEISHFCY